jgi:hypothetical protein
MIKLPTGLGKRVIDQHCGAKGVLLRDTVIGNFTRLDI